MMMKYERKEPEPVEIDSAKDAAYVAWLEQNRKDWETSQAQATMQKATPAAAVLVEDELDAHFHYAESNSVVRRAAAELRRLRKEPAGANCTVDTRIESLTCQVQLLAQQRDVALERWNPFPPDMPAPTPLSPNPFISALHPLLDRDRLAEDILVASVRKEGIGIHNTILQTSSAQTIVGLADALIAELAKGKKKMEK
jgi:hypothetical protein